MTVRNTRFRVSAGKRAPLRALADLQKRLAPWGWRLLVIGGKHVRFNTHARNLLDFGIIPLILAKRKVRRVVYVGCDYYSAYYKHIFHAQDFITIDSAWYARFFGGDVHYRDHVERLGAYVEPNSTQLIIMNGVFGHGLNQRTPCEAAFTSIYHSLEENGILIHGWNDVSHLCPFDVDLIDALLLFERLGRRIHVSQTRHVYDIYRKPPVKANSE